MENTASNLSLVSSDNAAALVADAANAVATAAQTGTDSTPPDAPAADEGLTLDKAALDGFAAWLDTLSPASVKALSKLVAAAGSDIDDKVRNVWNSARENDVVSFVFRDGTAGVFMVTARTPDKRGKRKAGEKTRGTVLVLRNMGAPADTREMALNEHGPSIQTARFLVRHVTQ